MYVSIQYIGEGNGTPLQYSCLENPMEGGAWWPAVHGVAKSQTRLNDFTFTSLSSHKKDCNTMPSTQWKLRSTS